MCLNSNIATKNPKPTEFGPKSLNLGHKSNLPTIIQAQKLIKQSVQPINSTRKVGVWWTHLTQTVGQSSAAISGPSSTLATTSFRFRLHRSPLYNWSPISSRPDNLIVPIAREWQKKRREREEDGGGYVEPSGYNPPRIHVGMLFRLAGWVCACLN